MSATRGLLYTSVRPNGVVEPENTFKAGRMDLPETHKASGMDRRPAEPRVCACETDGFLMNAATLARVCCGLVRSF